MASNDPRVTISKTFFEEKGTRKEEYSRREIQEFLEEESKDDSVLKAIVQMMKSLNPSKIDTDDDSPWETGCEYKIQEPFQIIYRTPQPEITLRKDKTFPTQTHYPYSDKPYWNFWSLLGLFLSLKYKAHPMSTTKDFFARLTIMYAWWCGELDPKTREKKTYPAVFQCTWGETNDAFDLFLGHSFKGAKGEKAWINDVKRERYNLVEAIVKRDNGINKWDFDKSPNRKDNNKYGTRFGNCAETYPFLSLLETKSENYITYGYALKTDLLLKKLTTNSDKKYDPTEAKKNYKPPCGNCEELLRLCGVKKEDVKVRYTSDGNWEDGPIEYSTGEPVVVTLDD